MITFNDVGRVVIESNCRDFCTHSARVMLKDERTRAIPSFLINTVISNLAKERINPDQKWTGDEVKHHFKDKTITDEWVEKSSEEILNSLFSEK